MKRVILFLGFFLCFAAIGNSQSKQLTLVVNQNLVIPGQDLWFGIYQKESLAKLENGKSAYPTVYMLIYDLTGKVVSYQLYSEKKESFTGKLRIPLTLDPGTYVLSATLFDNVMSKIQVEESITIHVLGDKNTVYYQFEKLGNCPVNGQKTEYLPEYSDCLTNLEKSLTSKANPSGIQGGKLTTYEVDKNCKLILDRSNKVFGLNGEISLNYLPIGNIQNLPMEHDARNKICFETIIDSKTPLICISKAENFEAMSAVSYFSSESDWMYDFAQLFAVPAKYRLPGFFHSGAKRIYQLKKAPTDVNYLLRIPESFGEQKGQFIDVITSASINEGVEERWLSPVWKCSSLQKVALDPERINTIKTNINKSLLIQSIYKNEIALNEKKAYNVEGVVADDHINMSLYQPFESLRLFFIEALVQIKVIKNKNKEDDIKMLNLDTRNPFPESPTLLVNGIIQEKSSDVFEIPYNEVDSISLYRQLKTTRNNFGALARNGVIEIHTKPGNKQKVNPIFLTSLMEEQKFEKVQTNIVQNNTQPFLSQTEFIGKPLESPFCYQHNDERGAFMIQIASQSGIKTYFYGVSLGMDE